MADVEQGYGGDQSTGQEYQEEGGGGTEENYSNGTSTNGAVDTSGGGPQGDGPPARSDDARKIFVGGLSWETGVNELREYFSKFGEVVDCTVKIDPNTGRPRGFGFVQFAEVGSIDGVMAEGSHNLQGKRIDPKRAETKQFTQRKQVGANKVFVGGLDPAIPEEDITEHFAQYGKITEMDLPFDKMKNQRRGFCFISFATEAICDAVVANPKHLIGSKEVEVKKATQKPENRFGGDFRGGRGGGRGGFGDRGGRGGRGGGYNQGGPQGYGGYGGGQGGPPQGGGGGGGYGGGPPGGYDYSAYYGNYDYSGYYNQAGGWGGYGQQQGAAASYGQYPAGYDYSAWYGQQQNGGQGGPPQGGSSAPPAGPPAGGDQGGRGGYGGGQQGDGQYKAPRGGGAAPGGGGGGYHPYQR